jgi:ATP-dependent Lhr-like helicase
VPPAGLPDAFLEPADQPLAGLVGRYARTHGPFTADAVGARLGVDVDDVTSHLAELERAGRVVRGELRPGGSGREWCDAEVLRRLRRASLAVARREVEPVDPQVLGRFLPRWHGIGTLHGRPGTDALRDLIVPLQGLALPAAQWEREVFPSRLGTYSPTWLDQLAGAGEIVWVGAGAMGRDGGRVALYFREDAPLIGPPPSDVGGTDELSHSLRAALGAGATFWDDLLASVEGSAQDIFTTLWGLVWAGEVTNDLWMPLRAPRRPPAARPTTGRFSRRGARGSAASGATAGRWSLSARLFATAPTASERLRAQAELLLERHGVVTRSAVLADGVPGGFAGVYPALGELETLGRCRRGYFMAGLGGAQFALPGAVERLRDMREVAPGEPTIVVLGAADPAQPFGAAVPWPARPGSERSPSRTFGARVVLVDGLPVLYVERGGRRLLTFTDDDARLPGALDALVAWVRSDRARRLAIERVNGSSVLGTPMEHALVAAGFQSGLRALELRGDDPPRGSGA